MRVGQQHVWVKQSNKQKQTFSVLYSVFLLSRSQNKEQGRVRDLHKKTRFKPRLKWTSPVPQSCALQLCSSIYTTTRADNLPNIPKDVSPMRICKVKQEKLVISNSKKPNFMLYIILFDSSLCQVSDLISLYDLLQEFYSKTVTMLPHR